MHGRNITPGIKFRRILDNILSGERLTHELGYLQLSTATVRLIIIIRSFEKKRVPTPTKYYDRMVTITLYAEHHIIPY